MDPAMDERLAKFVVNSHHHSHPANHMDELERAAVGAAGPAAWQAGNLVEQELLKMYIAYAKAHCHPKLQDADTEKMVQACPLAGSRAALDVLYFCAAFAFARARTASRLAAGRPHPLLASPRCLLAGVAALHVPHGDVMLSAPHASLAM